MKKVTIHLRGPFARFHNGPIVTYARTAAEALENVCWQIPGLCPDANGPRRVRVGGFNTVEDFYKELEVDELHLFPQINGGRNNGFTQIIIGVILIVTAFLLFGVQGVQGALAAMSTMTATIGQFLIATMVMVGVNMVIGGLIATLFPAPELNNDKKEGSQYLGAPQSTVRIGTPIPVQYGRRKRGFHYLSFNMQATKMGNTSTNTGYTPSDVYTGGGVIDSGGFGDYDGDGFPDDNGEGTAPPNVIVV